MTNSPPMRDGAGAGLVQTTVSGSWPISKARAYHPLRCFWLSRLALTRTRSCLRSVSRHASWSGGTLGAGYQASDFHHLSTVGALVK